MAIIKEYVFFNKMNNAVNPVRGNNKVGMEQLTFLLFGWVPLWNPAQAPQIKVLVGKAQNFWIEVWVSKNTAPNTSIFCYIWSSLEIETAILKPFGRVPTLKSLLKKVNIFRIEVCSTKNPTPNTSAPYLI